MVKNALKGGVVGNQVPILAKISNLEGGGSLNFQDLAWGLYTSLALPVRSVLHFRWRLYLDSTIFGTLFLKTVDFPIFAT